MDLNCILIALITILGYCKAATKEYCVLETFNPSCDDGEVIVMTKALYGRMRVGKCVPMNLGFLGCQKDVMSILDASCSGKQRCEASVYSISEQLSSQPCAKGVESYLEADYECRQVLQPLQECHQPQSISLVQNSGTLSSFASNKQSCQKKVTEWSLDLNPGQQVNISIIDFDRKSKNNRRSCDAVGYIREKGHISNVSICRSSHRKEHVYTSNGRSISIFISKLPPGNSEFLLEYTVYGCSDINVQSNAWYRREGEYATIGCERSDKIWKIRCENSNWVGIIGNCTDRKYNPNQGTDKSDQDTISLNKDFWFWIIIIVCLGVGILCVLCLVIIIVKCKRGNGSNPSTDKCGSDESHYRGLIRAQDAPPGYYPTGSTFSQTMPRNPNVSYPQKFATVQSDGRAPNYFVLDQEYMNMKDQNQV